MPAKGKVIDNSYLCVTTYAYIQIEVNYLPRTKYTWDYMYVKRNL